MAQEQLGRAAGADRFPNPNTLLGFTSPTSKPDPKYTETGTGPRGGPGVSQQAEGEKPANRSATTASPSEDAVPGDVAGARLSPVTRSVSQRSLCIRDLERTAPRYDPLQERESLGGAVRFRPVQPYEGDRLWGKRARNSAQDAQQDQDHGA